MASRSSAVANAGTRQTGRIDRSQERISGEFGSYVFHRGVMEKMLTRQVYQHVVDAMDGKSKLQPEHADAIATAMKEWALSHGATHYTHWFQPLTGATAEKHDAFIEWSADHGIIESFSGKQLIQGEPDASSFPSGGLRSTWEARGYTGWDPSSPVFLWRGGDGITLCIPSVFFSWTGAVLDFKIPLHRSEALLNGAAQRLLDFCSIQANRVYATLGWEQEYFIIDRELRNERPDLVLLGKTVQGAPSPKGQELQDHYFGAVKDRLLGYMQDFETAAVRLGIPVKTRHNEVSPAQHEIAPVFEPAGIAIDHNILLMELMRQVAVKHDLACLLHEKPFAGLNGSGKHNNWSVATDTGLNLLDPSDSPENSLSFLIMLCAVLEAVHDHSKLLLASIGSAGNDYRLGGDEAPPAIISVFLGSALETLLQSIEEHGQAFKGNGRDTVDLGPIMVPDLTRDETDRNRTSPFAFTGNKFEFRAVGSSANCSFPITVLNVAVARALDRIMDELEKVRPTDGEMEIEALQQAAMPVLQASLKRSKAIRFTGDNYSSEWKAEAQKRGLPMGSCCVDFFDALCEDKVTAAFEGVLTKEELVSRYEIMMETYSHQTLIEARLLVELYRLHALPAALRTQQLRAESLRAAQDLVDGADLKSQITELKQLSKQINICSQLIDGLNNACKAVSDKNEPERATVLSGEIKPKMMEARAAVDALEQIVDDEFWALPKYRELLFFV